MTEYSAPVKDMQFVLHELVNLDQLLALPGFESLESEVLLAVLEQAGAFAAEVLSPLNRVGDTEGCHFKNGVVTTASGWRQAYLGFAADGWNALGIREQIGGNALPAVVAALTQEMWHSANSAFALCPMLTRSGIEALDLAASSALRQIYLPPLVAGRWTATMNLTEPQAGSDLAAVKTRALPQPDGSFRLSGQKIFITYGEHDLSENIIHLVLARTPTAPAGVKGMSLFLVPKRLPNADGSVGAANAVRCLSIEHKLGIHGSPTCVMEFGGTDAATANVDGATGWLIGEENRGLEYMFVMMNDARFSVGIQGLGLAERAYQAALRFAKERRQGADAAAKQGSSVPIIRHPDVRRMLLEMKSTIEAMRALASVVAEAVEHARASPQAQRREQARAFVGLMTPVMKAWSTESAIALTSTAIQIHGGMGYIEETGVAQYWRDARIATIYEGTTGIQANDLVSRKIVRDNGRAAYDVIAAMLQTRERLANSADERLIAFGKVYGGAIQALEQAVKFMVAAGRSDLKRALAGAVPLLTLFGTVAGGWQLARSALAAQRRLLEGQGDADFYRAKILSACFYADHRLCEASGLAHTVTSGADSILLMADEQF